MDLEALKEIWPTLTFCVKVGEVVGLLPVSDVEPVNAPVGDEGYGRITLYVVYAWPLIFGNPAVFVVPAVALPSMNLSTRFGRLKVVELLPAPYVVPITLNSAAYNVLSTALPSHSSHPSGAEFCPAK